MTLFERKPLQKGILLLLSAWIAVYAFLFTRNQGMAVRVLSAVCWFALPCAGGFFLLSEKPLPFSRLKKIFFCLLAVFSAAWVLFSLNSSSIGIWQEILTGSVSVPVWGRARVIRGDEWAVWTPFLYAQAAENYPALNQAITAGSIDPTLIAIGGLPAWTPAAVFKPLYWGFLLLGTERGYSLLTLLRVVLLFAVSYLTALRYTGRSRAWSAAAAFLITLSPYVQWWFSQSIAEVLLFGQAMVLCWIRALEAEKERGRLGFSLLSAWCFGCFILVLYPAWLIPAGFLILAVILYQTVRSKPRFPVLLRMLLPFLLAGGLLTFIAVNSWDTVLRVLHSVYPGQRVYTGGNRPLNFFSGLYPLTFAVVSPPSGSDFSAFLSFAPAGLILAVQRFIRKKKADPFSVILLCFCAVFTLFAMVPFPAWLAKATLLYQCSRPVFIVSLCSLFLLIRTLSLRNKETDPAPAGRKKLTGLIPALLCAAGINLLTYFMLHPPLYLILGLIPVSAGIFWLLFSGAGRRFTALVLCLLAILSGAFVNPVQQGISEVENLPPVSLVRSLSPEADTVLAVEADWPVPNALLFSGARVLNSTQPYADPDRWAAVDPERQWLSVYNRFCHVSLRVAEQTSFRQLDQDHMRAELTLDNLKTLGAEWLVTQNTYPELELLGSGSEWNVYRLQ